MFWLIHIPASWWFFFSLMEACFGNQVTSRVTIWCTTCSWMIYWLIDLFAGCLPFRLIKWKTNWLTDWVNSWHIVCLTIKLTHTCVSEALNNWLTSWLLARLSSPKICCLASCVPACLPDWLNYGLTGLHKQATCDWLIHENVDQLPSCLPNWLTSLHNLATCHWLNMKKSINY